MSVEVGIGSIALGLSNLMKVPSTQITWELLQSFGLLYFNTILVIQVLSETLEDSN